MGTLFVGFVVTNVEYRMAVGSPSVTGFSTRVKNRTLLCAATDATSVAQRRRALVNMVDRR